MDSINGTVEKITFYNPENGYSVIKLLTDINDIKKTGKDTLVTIVGVLPPVNPGEFLKVAGKWESHSKHGMQFSVTAIVQSYPVELNGVKKFLGSGLIDGIGPKLAENIVNHFGEQTIDIINSDPARLQEVPDIGKKRSRQIIKSWQDQKNIREIMIFLFGKGISTRLAVKIHNFYGDNALEIVNNDPYQLSKDIYGIGFRTADKIAQSSGLPPDHPTRIESGLLYILEQESYNGNVFVFEKDLIERATSLLGLPPEKIPVGINSLIKAELINTESIPVEQSEQGRAIYLPELYISERFVAKKILELSTTLESRLSDIPPAFVNFDNELSNEQLNAVLIFLSNRVSILTGGPGTGKTTTIRAFIELMKEGKNSFALVSPTGRAAKRLSEAANYPASTIHRLLSYSPNQGFLVDEDNPLNLDALVVDEVSMLDISLMESLLRALKVGTHLILVGDFDQLPSVGAGDLLRDLIISDEFKVSRLSKIYRQSQDSQIILSAHKIKQGAFPDFNDENKDFFKFPARNPDEAINWIEDLLSNRIPEKFEIPPREIQVLAPMYRGMVGIHEINKRLQNVLNPENLLKPEIKYRDRSYRIGDKVIQNINDYDKDVFNGDIGIIHDINNEDRSLVVEFGGRNVVYTWNDIDQLALAYAISIHKSQGSEFPAVVIPLLTQHYLMLQRNLLYTAITRAKKLCVLITNNKALSIAIKNNEMAKRNSGLIWRLNSNKV